MDEDGRSVEDSSDFPLIGKIGREEKPALRYVGILALLLSLCFFMSIACGVIVNHADWDKTRQIESSISYVRTGLEDSLIEKYLPGDISGEMGTTAISISGLRDDVNPTIVKAVEELDLAYDTARDQGWIGNVERARKHIISTQYGIRIFNETKLEYEVQRHLYENTPERLLSAALGIGFAISSEAVNHTNISGTDVELGKLFIHTSVLATNIVYNVWAYTAYTYENTSDNSTEMQRLEQRNKEFLRYWEEVADGPWIEEPHMHSLPSCGRYVPIIVTESMSRQIYHYYTYADNPMLSAYLALMIQTYSNCSEYALEHIESQHEMGNITTRDDVCTQPLSLTLVSESGDRVGRSTQIIQECVNRELEDMILGVNNVSYNLSSGGR